MPNNTRQNHASVGVIGVLGVAIAIGAVVVVGVVGALGGSGSDAVAAGVAVADVVGVVVVVGGGSSDAGDVVVVVVVGVVAVVGVVLLTTLMNAISGTPHFWSSRAVTSASRLLPAEVRNDYREEWAAWMADLRADGIPRIQRFVELLTLILIAAPTLAITLRLDRRRVTGR
jgi:hypothetical protein